MGPTVENTPNVARFELSGATASKAPVVDVALTDIPQHIAQPHLHLSQELNTSTGLNSATARNLRSAGVSELAKAA